jgi:hypothetical protein
MSRDRLLVLAVDAQSAGHDSRFHRFQHRLGGVSFAAGHPRKLLRSSDRVVLFEGSRLIWLSVDRHAEHH